MSIHTKHSLLITGTPGIGKTTLIRKVVEALEDYALSGFYTEEIREVGVRKGFRFVTFGGEEGVIAHVDFNHRHSVGKYGVDVAAIDRLADIALNIDEDVDLYVVDEIGKMECLSSRFNAAMRRLLDSDQPLLATVSKKGGGLIEEAKHRADVELWEVTHANRDALVAAIVEWLHQRLED
jgi:nucleoside-triphosphatase